MTSPANGKAPRFPRPFLRAALHVHSEFSLDAWQNVPDIMETASASGLDAVLLTDHDSMGAREHGLEGWYDNTALIVGVELSTPGNHYLAFGLDQPVEKGLSGQELVDAVKEQGGIGFWAHPISKGSPVLPGVQHPWEMTGARGFTGLEIWTYLESWAVSVTSIPRALLYYRHPDLAIRGPHPEAIELWDRLCQEQPVVAVAGLDAHAYRVERELKRLGMHVPSFIDLTGAELFPYSHMFGTLRTNVYWNQTGPEVDGEYDAFARHLLGALGGGACFCSYDVIGDPEGFDFALLTGERLVFQGMNVAARDTVTAMVSVPNQQDKPLTVRLVRNGRSRVEASVTPGMTWQVDNLPPAGVYRVVIEVTDRQTQRPWIYSNPIYLHTT